MTVICLFWPVIYYIDYFGSDSSNSEASGTNLRLKHFPRTVRRWRKQDCACVRSWTLDEGEKSY